MNLNIIRPVEWEVDKYAIWDTSHTHIICELIDLLGFQRTHRLQLYYGIIVDYKVEALRADHMILISDLDNPLSIIADSGFPKSNFDSAMENRFAMTEAQRFIDMPGDIYYYHLMFLTRLIFKSFFQRNFSLSHFRSLLNLLRANNSLVLRGFLR